LLVVTLELEEHLVGSWPPVERYLLTAVQATLAR
jgi:hypothetical protein